MDDFLNATLQTGVEKQLAYVENILADADDPSKLKLADEVIPQWADAWRELLAVHASDERGRCRTCSARGPLSFRRARCTVWRTASRLLITGTSDSPNVGRHRLRGPRQTAS